MTSKLNIWKAWWFWAIAILVIVGAIFSIAMIAEKSEKARQTAELYCTLEGVLPPSTSIYSEEFKNCVEANKARFEE